MHFVRGSTMALYRGARQSPDMILRLISGLVVVASATLLIGLTVLVFAKPGVAERLFRGFASSARTHFAEQICRVLFGGSLVIYSSAMWKTDIFRLIGWFIVVTSVALMASPWQWHQRFAKQILPVFLQYMRLYAVGSFAFGAVILYAVFAPQLNGAV
jgi:uncharacterized protein YjeT (DUF2065 family)